MYFPIIPDPRQCTDTSSILAEVQRSSSVQSDSDILEASKFVRTPHFSDQVHNFLHFLISNFLQRFPHCQHFHTRLTSIFILKGWNNSKVKHEQQQHKIRARLDERGTFIKHTLSFYLTNLPPQYKKDFL